MYLRTEFVQSKYMKRKYFYVLSWIAIIGFFSCQSEGFDDDVLIADEGSGYFTTPYEPDTLALDTLSMDGVNLPPEPDYSDESMWYIRQGALGDAQVDVFYTCPTEIITDYVQNWKTYGHMNVYDDNQRKAFMVTFEKALPAFSITANFYSFYYRQITLQSFASERTVAARFPYAFQDVKRAFNYYLEHFNNGRPFIIAGFSQGGKAAVELVKALTPSLMKQMVVAYVMGYKVTEDDLLQSPNIQPASGAIDTGVTCCFSSVGDESSVWSIIQGNVACGINPINWRTDDTPAEVPWAVGEDPSKPVVVHKNLKYNIMFVDNYGVFDFGFYPVTWVMGKKNYHLREFTLYSPSLVQNIAERTAAYMSKTTGIRDVKW